MMMRRGANGEMRSANDAMETINAAATAIASAENRASQGSVQVQKRRWGNCFSIYWCFGSQKQNKRIGHAVYDSTETTAPGEDRFHSVDNSTRTTTSIMLPFVAPPSSPASFLQSEPPSATQSPAGVISFSSMSANMYSPGGPASIFAIGPYAHETQLVSPPVFSTFTTEPSTAPFTPPPESVHLTTPSSPEVPFAKLLDPNHQNMFPSYPHEFQSYQLQPGSPISRLLSPGSAISGSGTSSPFPDREFGVGDPYFLEFRTGDPPKLLNLEKIAPHEWGSGSRQRSGTLTPDRLGTRSHDNFKINHQSSDATPVSTNPYNRWKNDETVLNHRVSFEVTAEDFLRCMEKKPGLLSKSGFAASLEKEKSTAKEQECPPEIKFAHESYTVESSGESFERASGDGEDRNRHHHNNQSITLGSTEEFNFDHVNDELSDKPIVAGSDWWANEKDLGQGSGPCQKWSFFPMMHTGIR